MGFSKFLFECFLCALLDHASYMVACALTIVFARMLEHWYIWKEDSKSHDQICMESGHVDQSSNVYLRIALCKTSDRDIEVKFVKWHAIYWYLLLFEEWTLLKYYYTNRNYYGQWNMVRVLQLGVAVWRFSSWSSLMENSLFYWTRRGSTLLWSTHRRLDVTILELWSCQILNKDIFGIKII